MARINVPPTRSNLIHLRQELIFAQQGYEILDRKREVLTTELFHLAHDAEALQRRVWKLMIGAYAALERAKFTMGQEHVEWASLAVNKTVEVQLKFRGVMGVPIPMIDASGEPPKITYSLGNTTAALDEASAAFREVLSLIPELAELETSVWRLARELRKTQRRVNALQHIFIPNYEETIAFIVNLLEEHEREETFRLKRLKTKTKKPKIGPPRREYEQPHHEIADQNINIYEGFSEEEPDWGEFG